MNFVFIIMPVSADPEHEKKKTAIKKILDAEQIEAHFPLDKRHSFDLEETVKDIRRSWFVLADLSYGRPSCYYELGLCQGIGKQTSLIAKEGTILYQLSGSVNTYSDIESFKKLVAELVQEIKASENYNQSWSSR